MKQLETRWKQEEGKLPLQEYPRPQMEREQYEILNGRWQYAITGEEREPSAYEGEILVPFSPEAAASGVNRILQPGETLHYRRNFVVPKLLEGKRLLLHFGAVDERCRVLVNGHVAGSHRGGYLPFSFDITGYLQQGENTLYVGVQDDSDTSYHARGKQKLNRGGMFYQAQSGIWQTVWTEWVPEEYIESLKITPCFDKGCVKVKVFSHGRAGCPVQVKVTEDGLLLREGEGVSETTLTLPMEHFRSWSPEDPHLYGLEITMGEDRVKSYFAMRKFSVGEDAHGVKRFFLNNRPYFQNGLLDQGYWPESLLTPPCEEAMVYDICTMKELGYNMLRKHVKVEPLRWYYHCDRLGMLVWQDMVNGGTDYHMKFICVLPNALMWTGRIIPDGKGLYGAYSRKAEEGRREYYRDLKGLIRHLYNVPSLCAWVPFNEGWGQFDAGKASRLTASLDSTRQVDEASGWFDQGGGDMYSIHNYWRSLRVRPKNRVVALTEYGGYSYLMEGHSCCEKVYGYRTYTSSQELTKGYEELIKRDILPNLKKGLSAAVYTQVSDIEDEVNGILTYDREKVKLLKEKVKELNRRICEEFNKVTGR